MGQKNTLCERKIHIWDRQTSMGHTDTHMGQTDKHTWDRQTHKWNLQIGYRQTPLHTTYLSKAQTI